MPLPGKSKRTYRFGLFEADPSSGELLRQGVRIRLQDQPFRVLCLLLERPGDVITREELRNALWAADTYVEFDGSLNAALKKLRSALGDSSENPVFIETLPKRGYRFLAPVTVQEPAAEEIAKPSQAASPTEPSGLSAATPVPAKNNYLWQSAAVRAVLLGIVLVATAVFEYGNGRWWNHGTQAKAVTPRRSMAVLGFANTSGRGEDAWLSTALSEMLSTEMAAGDQLRIVPGEEVAQLQTSAPWPQTGVLSRETTSRIGTTLESDLLVLGSYTSVGEPGHRKLRLDVRLQDAGSGNIVAEAAESGSEEELFHLASDVGNKLRNSLGLANTTVIEQAGALASSPSNPEAVQFYSLGLVKLREADYRGARGLFEQATKADAKFPLAYAMLSRTDIFLGNDELAKKEAKQALDLSGNLSRVKKMEIEASYDQANADRAKAAEIYRVLFNLFPDSLDYGLQLAKLQLESYRPDEALETIRQLRALPPPARDDPGLDLREAGIVMPRDAEAADRLYHSAAAKAQAQGKKLVYAKAQEAICYVNRQHLQSPPECREAYEIFLAAGNRADAGTCVQLMAENNRQTGHDQEAIPLYEQALGMFKESGNREMIGVTLNNLSLVLQNEGQWGTAEKKYREAEENFEAVNDRANTSAVAANVADIETLRGDWKSSSDFYRKSWELVDSSGRGRHEYPHIRHAALLLMQGQLQAAKQEANAQIDSLRAYKADPWQLANALTVLGDVEKEEGDLTAARKSYSEAMETEQKANAPTNGVQISLAELSVVEGHSEVAEQALRAAIADLEKTKSVGDEVNAYTALGRALLAEGKVAEARDSLSHAYKLADLESYPVLNLPLRLLQARAAAAKAGRSDLEVAAREIRAVIQKAHELGWYQLESEARLSLGEVEVKVNASVGRSLLKELADDCRSRGFLLVAKKAGDLAADTTVASAGH